MRSSFAILIGLAASACCQGYRARSFESISLSFEGERRTIGCIDVAVAGREVPAAEGPVAQLTFGNGCDAAVLLDLASIQAIGVLADGRRVPLALRDPDAQVVPARIEARNAAREAFEYVPPEPGATLAALCLDLSRIDAEVGAIGGDHANEVCVTP
jgi:hypothetical protein